MKPVSLGTATLIRRVDVIINPTHPTTPQATTTAAVPGYSRPSLSTSSIIAVSVIVPIVFLLIVVLYCCMRRANKKKSEQGELRIISEVGNRDGIRGRTMTRKWSNAGRSTNMSSRTTEDNVRA